MARCVPDRPAAHADRSDGGFATALAMTVSLAIGLTATVLLIRSQLDLTNARHRLERTEAEYRLSAIQELAARTFQSDTGGLKLHRIEFEGISAGVKAEAEQGKLLPEAAAKLPGSWLAALGVAAPETLKDKLEHWPLDRPLLMEALAELDSSPLWRACAAEAISANGSPPGVAAAFQSGDMVAAGGAKTLRLTAVGDDGSVDDRVVRLTGDPANPVVVLDRRFYRRTGAQPACPAPPDFGSST